MAETAASAATAVTALNADARPRQSKMRPVSSAAAATSPSRPNPEPSGGPANSTIKTVPKASATPPAITVITCSARPTASLGPAKAEVIFNPANTEIATVNTMTELVA